MPQAKVTPLSHTLQTLFNQRANELAQETGMIQRQRILTGSGLVKALVFGWLAKPEATLENLAQRAAALGEPITAQGLDLRFTDATARCLKRLLEEALAQLVEADPVALALFKRFAGGVFLLDSSTVTLPLALAEAYPGCGSSAGATAALKVHVCWNVSTGALYHLEVSPARRHDRASQGQALSLPSGALRIADLGYFTLPRLRELGQQGVFWLSRLRARTGVFAPDGTRLDLARWLNERASGTGQVDQAVLVGAAERLPCRLLAIRVPESVSAERRRRLRQQARKRGQTVSQARLALADWTILITNAEQGHLDLEEALVLYRVRWQVELLFKLWKQHGGLDQWRTAKAARIVCEVYGKLLAMLLLHWVLLLGSWHHVDRSLFKAAQTVRSHALHVMVTLDRLYQLRTALLVLSRTLAAGCRIGKRGQPATYQLLLNLDENPLT